MFGLEWGMPPEAALARLALLPVDRADGQLVVALDELVARVSERRAFCPSMFLRLGDACEGRLHLGFVDGGLAGGDLRFRFPFEAIGKSADGLSDQAMAAFARTEMQGLLHEFIARYGPPVHSTESFMRWEHAHPVAIVVFQATDGETLQVLMGHDGGGVIGALRYLPPIAPDDGF